jgi:hypothetical protein
MSEIGREPSLLALHIKSPHLPLLFSFKHAVYPKVSKTRNEEIMVLQNPIFANFMIPCSVPEVQFLQAHECVEAY